jgi:nucleotide-binding universal stress UspA family protein
MKILCATDFSDAGQAAEAQALALARALGAELVYVHVNMETMLYGEGPLGMSDVEQVYEAQRRWAEDALAQRVASAEGRSIRARAILRRGLPPDEIAAAVQAESPDMLVVGTHGRSGLARLMMGSVAEQIVKSAACPVLTVRPDTPQTRAA